jgi:hypothetical protein
LLQIWGDPVVAHIKAVAPLLAAFGRRLQRGGGILLIKCSYPRLVAPDFTFSGLPDPPARSMRLVPLT